MPHQTFLNLSRDRQAEVFRVAQAEFTRHDYDSASLTQIIADLGITRGAFYRYFDGKRELYDFVLATCLEEKRRFIAQQLDVEAGDFFAILRSGMGCHVAFQFERPEAAGLLAAAYRNADLSLENFLFLEDAKQTMAEGLRLGQAAGTLRTDVEAELILLAIAQLLMGLGPYIAKHGTPQPGQGEGALDRSRVQGILDQAVLLLRSGFGAPGDVAS